MLLLKEVIWAANFCELSALQDCHAITGEDAVKPMGNVHHGSFGNVACSIITTSKLRKLRMRVICQSSANDGEATSDPPRPRPRCVAS